MTFQALNAALDRGLTQATDHGMLDGLVAAVAANAADPGLRRRCRVLADDGGAADPLVYNVLCAGLFGVAAGGPGLSPTATSGENLYRVNVFLHGVRKAILACRPLKEMRRARARNYIFYPEFLFIADLRERVAAVARAHAGLGPRDSELTVLYALAGDFGLSDASRAASVIGWIERQMQSFAPDAAMEQAINADESFAELRPGLARTRQNIAAAANDKLREMHNKTLAMILANARLMQRQKLARDSGAARSLQDWWGPGRCADLQPANAGAIHRLLSA